MEFQVFSPEEHRQLYHKLISENDDYSFPVRGMLSLIMSDKIKRGMVFVDHWPRYSSVACLQETLEFSDIDNDILTIYSKNEVSLKPFLRSLQHFRKWDRRGLLIMYIRKEFIGLAKDVLSTSTCQDLGSLYLHERPFGNDLTQLYNKYVKEELKKYPGFIVTPVGQDDVPTIVDLYPSPIPAKIEMFRWMVSNLPSSSLRDPQGRLVGWCVTYSCGAGGVLYVKPEYRRSGFAALLGLVHGVEQINLYSDHQYGAVSPDNTASIELNKKLRCRQTDALANWVIFTPKTASKL